MAEGKKVFGFFILLVCIVLVGLFIWSKINPNVNIFTEILSGSVTGLVMIIFGIILLITFVKMLKNSFGK
jgi:hypothetical protein